MDFLHCRYCSRCSACGVELSRAVLGNVTVVAAMGRCSNEHLVLASSAVLMLVLLAVAARRCTDVGALTVVSSVEAFKFQRFQSEDDRTRTCTSFCSIDTVDVSERTHV